MNEIKARVLFRYGEAAKKVSFQPRVHYVSFHVDFFKGAQLWKGKKNGKKSCSVSAVFGIVLLVEFWLAFAKV